MIALLWLAGCNGDAEAPPPPPPGRVLEGPLVGRGLAADGDALWVAAPGVDGAGGVYRFDTPAGSVGLADADVAVTASGPAGVGAALAPCDDLDGDGVSDLVVGSPDQGRYGGAWLVRGPLADAVLADQPFAEGFRDEGHAGASVACGDTDGDGIGEIAIAAPDTVGLGQSHDVGSIGFHRLEDGEVDKFGNFDSTWSDSHLGFRSGLAMGDDLDGDGVGDLAIGGWGADKVHLVMGPLQGSYDANLAGPTLQGEDEEGTGHSVAVGDMDGDGANDLLVGTPLAGGSAGGAWVVLGPFGDGDDGLLRNRGFQLEGVQPGDQAGFAVAFPGDVDGDGGADVLIGAPFAGGVGPEAGAAYLVLVPDGPANLDAADALLLGEVERGRLGWAVAGLDSPAGPLLVVAAPEADVGGTVGAGTVYAWPGSTRGTNYPDAAAFRIGP